MNAGRELFTLADCAQHLCQVGPVGCARATGLGIALVSARSVLVVDGAGAPLMKLGNLVTIGAEAPRNLVHLVPANGVHDSTGGQPTVSGNVRFAGAALACGDVRAHSKRGLRTATSRFQGGLADAAPSVPSTR